MTVNEVDPDVDIVEFVAGDGDRLQQLYAVVIPDAPTVAADEAERHAFLSDATTFALGAYDDGAPVGLAWGIQMRSPSGRLTTYLHELEVSAEHRRKGVATALVREAMRVGAERGSTKFWLSTGGHNEAAQALYASLGGDRKELGDVNYWWDLD